MKFKTEIFLLLVAIALFAASAFLYSGIRSSEGVAAASASQFPYQGYAFPFVGFGGLLMVTASVSFLKRSKGPYVRVPKSDFNEDLH